MEDNWENSIELNKSLESKFELLHKMLDRLQEKLIKYDAYTGIEFIQPISNMLIEAVWQLAEEEQKREEDGDNLLNIIIGNPNA